MLSLEQTRRGQAAQELIQALQNAASNSDGRLAALFISPLALIFRGNVKTDVPVFPVEPSTNALDSEINAYNAAVTNYYSDVLNLASGFDALGVTTFYELSGSIFVDAVVDGDITKMQITVNGLRPQLVYLDR